MSTSWITTTDDRGIAWLSFDLVDSSANVLGEQALSELDHALIAIAQAHPTGLVIHSAKPQGFIAGADVKAFARLIDARRVEDYIRDAQNIFARLERLPFPTLAAIHGYCMGGGLELALACRYILCSDDPSTRFAFPEVRLGIFPAFGGSVRSLRRVGDLAALDLMLTGRALDARAAKRLGLADEVVPRRQLETAAGHFILNQPRRPRLALARGLPGATPLRPLVALGLRRKVAATTRREHYPAPFALIDHWRRHARDDAAMYRSEAMTASALLSGATAQNLVRVFLLQDRLKAAGDRSLFRPKHVHVVGGGTMGGDIAAWCALQGLRVSLQDRTAQQLSRAMGRACTLFERKLRRDGRAIRNATDRLLPDPKGSALASADVVIEAIFEDIAAKQALFRDIEARARPDTLLATNTSSITLEAIAGALAAPERLVGLHFFNPVAKMPLVEVVHGQATSPDSLSRASAFCRHIDKLPLVVKSAPGFLVNRILMPYLLEAVALIDEGIAPESVDAAAVDFGMPVGPVELADSVGLDICLSVAEKLAGAEAVPASLRLRVKAGKLGKKNEEGFYRWNAGKPRKEGRRSQSGAAGLVDRLVLRMLNEAVACLREGIVEDEDLLDAGVIFGTGFAPFRGGPIRYLRTAGVHRQLDRLTELEKAEGPRFAADPGWMTLDAI